MPPVPLFPAAEPTLPPFTPDGPWDDAGGATPVLFEGTDQPPELGAPAAAGPVPLILPPVPAAPPPPSVPPAFHDGGVLRGGVEGFPKAGGA